MTHRAPILSGGKGPLRFDVFEPIRGECSLQCRVIIRDAVCVVSDMMIHGEDRANAIHCAIISLDGFFEDLQLPPRDVAHAMDALACQAPE